MRKRIGAAACAALIPLAAVAPQSSASSSVTAAAARRCSETYSRTVSLNTNPQYAKGYWETNTCLWYLEVRATCYNAIDNYFYARISGAVRTDGYVTKAKCDPADVLTRADRRVNAGSGWGSWGTYWTK